MSTVCPASPPVDPDDDRNAAVLAPVAAGVDGDTLAERVEALSGALVWSGSSRWSVI